jgi:hypothetical protein
MLMLQDIEFSAEQEGKREGRGEREEGIAVRSWRWGGTCQDTLLLCLLTFEVSRHGVVLGGGSFTGPLGSPLGADSPSLCLSLIVGICRMASLAWGSLSPDLSTGGGSEQRERPSHQ